MRSVYAKILLWCFGVLVLSLAAFIAISVYVSFLAPGKNLFVNISTLQIEEATEAYETGGPARLAAYLKKLDRIFLAGHYLLDPSGKDLATGEDRSSLFAKARNIRYLRPLAPGDHVIVKPAANGRYRFVLVLKMPLDFSN